MISITAYELMLCDAMTLSLTNSKYLVTILLLSSQLNASSSSLSLARALCLSVCLSVALSLSDCLSLSLSLSLSFCLALSLSHTPHSSIKTLNPNTAFHSRGQTLIGLRSNICSSQVENKCVCCCCLCCCCSSSSSSSSSNFFYRCCSY